ASVHAILDGFGGVSSIEELNGPKVHRLENILILGSFYHDAFDQLQLWLENRPNGSKYTYVVKASAEHDLRSLLNRRVEFTTTDTVNLPLPDPRYFRLHAACARAADLSGAEEYNNRILREAEATGVLAADGGSSELLDYVLMSRL
ncbi:uncharacterized protein C8Q71DRAFT_691789, partial [Rhodofomes roseus]